MFSRTSTPMRSGVTFVILGASTAFLLTGCSGTTSDPVGSTLTSALKTPTPTLITDAPKDGVIALGLTINSIRLFTASGGSTDVLSSPATIEASHLDGVQEPLQANLDIPQGTYTSATITVSNPSVTYIDPTTHNVVTTTATLTASTDTVTFNSPISVTSTSSPIVFDLLVGQSLALSGTTATVTPVFDVRQITLNSSPTNGKNGRLNDLFGTVASVSGTTLNLTTASGAAIAITTNSSTAFHGFTALSQLSAGEVVDVDYAQQTSGALLALRIQLHNGVAANELIGMVTATAGSPITSFTETARQWLGSGTASTMAGTSYTIAVTGATTFALPQQLTAYAGLLPFTPAFNASTLFAGQNVAVQSASINGTAATAASVTLVPQTVDGTVSAVTTAGGLQLYMVTLPSDSALSTLTGATMVQVYVTQATQTMNSTAITTGNTVRFNGLLFKNAGALTMLAGNCSDGESNAPPQHH